MENPFISILKGRVVLVGIGNLLRADDGVGPLIISRLQDKKRAFCIDAGTTPENYIGKIAKENPDTILLIDALHCGKPAGEFSIVVKQDIAKSGFTTHDMSPHLFIDFLSKQTKADIFMLGIQPQTVNLGEEMTEPVKHAADTLEQLLLGALHK